MQDHYSTADEVLKQSIGFEIRKQSNGSAMRKQSNGSVNSQKPLLSSSSYSSDSDCASATGASHYMNRQGNRESEFSTCSRPGRTDTSLSVRSNSVESGALTIAEEDDDDIFADGRREPRIHGATAPTGSEKRKPAPPIPNSTYHNVDSQGQHIIKVDEKRSTVHYYSQPSCSGQRPTGHRDVGVLSIPGKSSKKSSTRRCCRRVVWACFVATFSLAAAAAFLSMYTYMGADFGKEEYCLACSLLTSSVQDSTSLGDRVTIKEVKGETMCCISSGAGLSQMIAGTQQKERKNFARNQNLTTAHVGLYADMSEPNAQQIERASHYSLLTSANPDHGITRNVVRGPKSLGILTTGWYFVYSSIHFNMDQYEQTCNKLPHKTWVHHVMLYRQTRHRPLLRAEHTCCLGCKTYRTSSFTGGIFELHKGDNVMVDVSAPPLVAGDKSSSLGLFLVDKSS